MSNILLNKADGSPLVIPTGSIRAIVSLDFNRKKDDSGPRSVLMTDLKGCRAFFMADTASSIADRIDKHLQAKRGALRLGKAYKDWLVFTDEGDNTYLEPGSVIAAEGVSYSIEDGGEKFNRLRITWRKPDGNPCDDDVSQTPDNLALLDAAEI